MNRAPFLRTCLMIALLAGVSLTARAHDDDQDYSKVNGSVRVGAGLTVGDASTVNGSITIERGATAADVESVNGRVAVEEGARVQSVETVNGSITLAEKAVVSDHVEAVNGSIRLRDGARVAGDVENVNGDIDLEAATIDGRISTVNADIDVGARSRVTGGIQVEKRSSWGWGKNNSDPPRITIGEGAVVGPLDLGREVELVVAPSATVGPITGVTPKRL
jgi:DUF4097 and DUF4098 domain-containing protein YvlB